MTQREGSFPKPEKKNGQEQKKLDFFNTCRDIKLSLLPDWNPPFHPDKALTASPEDKRLFADSLAQAYERHTGSKLYIKRANEAFDGTLGELKYMQVINSLGLADNYRQVETKQEQPLVSPEEFARLQAGWDAKERAENKQRREENKTNAEMYEVCQNLVYLDLISSTDIGELIAMDDPQDETAAETFTNQLSEHMHKSIVRYPMVQDALRKRDKDDGIESSERTLFMTLLTRLNIDYPRKPQEKKSFLSKLFRKKEEPQQEPKRDVGSKVVEAAINALIVEYSHNPQYTSIGQDSRPISEMAQGLMENEQAVNHLMRSGVLEQQVSATDKELALRAYLHQELQNRGIQA